MSGDDEVHDADGRDGAGPRGDAGGPTREGGEGGAGDGDGDGNSGGPGRDVDEPSGTAELTAFLAARYPGRGLDGDRRERLRERVADLRERGEALEAVDLSNGDEPVTTFVPYRGNESDGERGGGSNGDDEGEGDGNRDGGRA